MSVIFTGYRVVRCFESNSSNTYLKCFTIDFLILLARHDSFVVDVLSLYFNYTLNRHTGQVNLIANTTEIFHTRPGIESSEAQSSWKDACHFYGIPGRALLRVQILQNLLHVFFNRLFILLARYDLLYAITTHTIPFRIV